MVLHKTRHAHRRLQSLQQAVKLTASEAEEDDFFGRSVAIDGDTVVVGAYDKDDNTGAVYVFRTTDGGATYGQVAKLTAADAAAYDYFGRSVAIDGDTIVVGAYGDDAGGSSSGSVYVFRTTDGGATYGQVAKLAASDAAAGDYLGWPVAIDGDTVVVGAIGDNDAGSDSGSAYVFRVDMCSPGTFSDDGFMDSAGQCTACQASTH